MILELTTALKTGKGEIFHPGQYNSDTVEGIPKLIMQEYNYHVSKGTLERSCIKVVQLDPEPVDGSEEVDETKQPLDLSEKLEAGKKDTNDLDDAAQDENDSPAASTETEKPKKPAKKAATKKKGKSKGLGTIKKGKGKK